jgi:hypothetical protein
MLRIVTRNSVWMTALTLNFCLNTPTNQLMECSPPSETDSRSDRPKIPRLSWDQKFHYRIYNSPPLVPILSQMYLAHTFPSYFPKIHSNIILPPDWYNYCPLTNSLTDWLTNGLTPWNRILVKKFSTLSGTKMLITVFTTAHHWSLSWATRTQSHPTTLCP